MLSYGFFNSINHDRRYNADDFSRLFDGLITDGVFGSIGDMFQVLASQNGMIITVGSGKAWFDHTWTYNDYALPLRVSDAELNLTRIDAVIIEVNHSIRSNSIKIIKGTGASPAEKPELINTDEIKQYPLAYITIPANTIEITNEMIENVVGPETPFVDVDDTIDQQDIDTLATQWTSEFGTSFKNWEKQEEETFEEFVNRMVDHLNSTQVGILTEALLHKENLPNKLTGTLPANQRNISFTSNYLKDNSLIDVYTNPYGISLVDITQTGETLYLTFKPVSHDTEIMVLIRDTNMF